MPRLFTLACSLAFVSPFAVWAVLSSACGTDRVDAHCTPDDPSYEDDPSCIYSDKGEVGPFPKGVVCVPDDADAGMPTPPTTCPTEDEVFGFFNDPAKGNCSNAACHGDPSNPAAGIFLSASDRNEMYIVLTTVNGTVGKPYVAPGSDAYTQSWIICNLISKAGGGYPMPPQSGLPNYADAQVIRDWLLCGAPGPQ